jgi:histidinol phosphatase-like enzyme (inositol monophosphatase family)
MILVDFSSFVEELADISGRAVLPFFRSALTAQNKAQDGGFDPVTEADKAAESVMRYRIRNQFPDHGIIGEEFASHQENAEYVWILDPIDGTRAFLAGLPVWGTLIGLMHRGTPCFGMMSQPFIGERFWGDGGEARYQGPAGSRVLQASRCTQLSEAILSATTPAMFSPTELSSFRKVEDKACLTRYGGDAYGYCLLAAGHIDLVIEADLKPCDILPLIPILTGAGAIVTTWDGQSPFKGGQILAAATPALHEQAIALLTKP